jgi:hypothetical protein
VRGPAVAAGDYLCSLHDGDLITVQWSGELRLVAVVVSGEGVALRDLTEDEQAHLEEEAARMQEEAVSQWPI